MNTTRRQLPAFFDYGFDPVGLALIHLTVLLAIAALVLGLVSAL